MISSGLRGGRGPGLHSFVERSSAASLSPHFFLAAVAVAFIPVVVVVVVVVVVFVVDLIPEEDGLVCKGLEIGRHLRIGRHWRRCHSFRRPGVALQTV